MRRVAPFIRKALFCTSGLKNSSNVCAEGRDAGLPARRVPIAGPCAITGAPTGAVGISATLGTPARHSCSMPRRNTDTRKLRNCKNFDGFPCNCRAPVREVHSIMLSNTVECMSGSAGTEMPCPPFRNTSDGGPGGSLAVSFPKPFRNCLGLQGQVHTSLAGGNSGNRRLCRAVMRSLATDASKKRELH